jgi:hypothetical protein
MPDKVYTAEQRQGLSLCSCQGQLNPHARQCNGAVSGGATHLKRRKDLSVKSELYMYSIHEMESIL